MNQWSLRDKMGRRVTGGQDRSRGRDRREEAGRPEAELSGIRLQKVLAAAGVGSRRACEELIAEGRVEVDGRRVTRQGMRIDPSRSVVRVDGLRLPTAPDLAYLAFNKPRGVVSTMSDPHGRPCLGDYVSQRPERLFHVGRLDTDTSGLLLLTGDGELAHRLTHPSYRVLKTYVAEVEGTTRRDFGARFAEGVELDDGVVAVDGFRVLQRGHGRTLVEVVLHEGRKHVVRRLLDAMGHPVRGLVRTQIGPIALGELRPGELRPLTIREVGQLYAAVDL